MNKYIVFLFLGRLTMQAQVNSITEDQEPVPEAKASNAKSFKFNFSRIGIEN